MYDAVFIGSGHNSLAAAVLLAKAGWKVGVFEQADEVGGAIRTAEWTLPGFRHDAFSATHVLIFLSPFYRKMRRELERHGLKYRHFPVQMASIFPDGDAVSMHRDLEGTLESLGRQSREDAAGWKKLYEGYRAAREVFSTLFSSPLPSLRTMGALLGPRLRLGPRGTMEFAQDFLLPIRVFADRHFSTEKGKAWFAPWGLHLPHSPETAGGGAFAWLVLGVGQDPEGGMAMPEGGGGSLTRAMASLLESLGGEVRTGVRVEKVVVRRNTAQGVRLADGTEVRARKAVVACTTPTQLFLDLVEEKLLPAEFVGRVRRYRYGVPLMKIDYALDRPPAWISGEETARAGLIHLARDIDQMSLAFNQALRGLLPEEPLVILTQPTVVDHTRAPKGRHIVWVVARVPHRVRGDAAGEIEPGEWRDIKERYADRLTDIVERYAPGFKASVLARKVLSPVDLEELDPNLVKGDAGAGAVELDQLYVFRPLPGWSRYATPVKGLWMTGAATHPGPGITAMSGSAVADVLLSAT
ncbi:MAG TPA: dehydrogenase [Clostridiales bacterium]|nr:dehydrogenase [Clostridiales bacterium]